MKLINGNMVSQTARTLPGRAYFRPEQFELELERIWYKKWLCAGREEEVAKPGDFFLRQVGFESLLFVRGHDGQIHGFYNTCRHRGSRLCVTDRGHFRSQDITCPYHSWKYQMDNGDLISAPGFVEGLEGFDRSRYPLKSFIVKRWQGFIWFTLADERVGQSEDDFPNDLGYYEKYRLAQLKTGRTMTYDVKANWKLIMENSIECYHCTTIHPQLSRATPPSNPWWWNDNAPTGLDFMDVGGMTLAQNFERASLTGQAVRPRFSTITDEDARAVYYFSVLPHTLFGLAADYVFCFTLWPLGPEETRVIAYWLADPSVLDQDQVLDDAFEFWDMTNRQDWMAIELAQKGVKSRAFKDGGIVGADDWLVGKFVHYIQSQVGEVTS